MKTLLHVFCLSLVFGCTSTHVETPGFTLDRTSFLQKIGIPAASFEADGSAKLEGYSSDGGIEALHSAIGAAFMSAIKASPLP